MLVTSIGTLGVAVALIPSPPHRRVGILGRRDGRRAAPWWGFLVASVAALAACGLLTPSATVSLGMVVAASWFLVRAHTRGRRAERQRGQVAGVMNRVARHLGSGAQPAEALASVTDREEGLHSSLRAELRGVAAGLAPSPGATSLVPELGMVFRLWEAAQGRGVSLAPLLDHVCSSMEQGMRHRREVRARLVGPQTTAVVLSILPLAGVGLGAAMGAHPLTLLLGGGLGGFLLMAGTALLCLGALWSYWLIERAGDQR